MELGREQAEEAMSVHAVTFEADGLLIYAVVCEDGVCEFGAAPGDGPKRLRVKAPGFDETFPIDMQMIYQVPRHRELQGVTFTVS